MPPQDDPIPSIDWRTRTIAELVEHLVSHHHAFARRELDRALALAHEAEAAGSEHACGRRVLRPLIEALRTDLFVHMQREEAHLFALVRTGASGGELGGALSTRLPASRIAGEHAVTAVLLRGIQAISDGFSPPEGADAHVVSLYGLLAPLVADIRVHLDLEESVLLPAIEARARAH